MSALSDIVILLIACAAVSGMAAFLGLFGRQDSKVRVRAIGALTLGLLIGFSAVWAALATYLRHRFAGDPILQVPYLGVQVGIVVASVLCGLVFSERSAGSPLSYHATAFGKGWITSPMQAFWTGLMIGVLAPIGMGALGAVFWAASLLFT